MAKVIQPAAKKITITHPRTGHEFEIDAVIYNPFKSAILESLKKSKGKTFTELTDGVTEIIRRKMPGFKKSIPWYTISILLDMEARGIAETFTEKGKKLNRIKK